MLERIVAGRLNKQIADDLGHQHQDGRGAPRQHHGEAERQHRRRPAEDRARRTEQGLTHAARLIDGTAHRARAARRASPAAPPPSPRPAAARSRRHPGRRRSGEPGLRPQQGQGLRGGRHPLAARRPTRRRSPRPSCWRASPRSTPTRRSTASWCRCRCRSRSTPAQVIEAIDARKDVDGYSIESAGRLVAGRAGLSSVHAVRLHAADREHRHRTCAASTRS